MSDINLSRSGPPETVITPDTPEQIAALQDALDQEDPRAAVSGVVAKWPTFLDAWAHLGRLARDDVEAYAAFRVGYHRGLDRLRASGWRGSGFVRWQFESNRGFLRALHGLANSARAIDELDEAERCDLFLKQLDPSWPPESLD